MRTRLRRGPSGWRVERGPPAFGAEGQRQRGGSMCEGSGARSRRRARLGLRHPETVPAIIRRSLSLSLSRSDLMLAKLTACSRLAHTCLSRAPGGVRVLGTPVLCKQRLPFLTHALPHTCQRSRAEKATDDRRTQPHQPGLSPAGGLSAPHPLPRPSWSPTLGWQGSDALTRSAPAKPCPEDLPRTF